MEVGIFRSYENKVDLRLSLNSESFASINNFYLDNQAKLVCTPGWCLFSAAFSGSAYFFGFVDFGVLL